MHGTIIIRKCETSIDLKNSLAKASESYGTIMGIIIFPGYHFAKWFQVFVNDIVL